MKRAALFLAAALALAGCASRPFVATTPAGFVDLGEKYPNGEYRATTADGVVLRVRAFENDPKGPLDFWSRTVERRMREM
ncbi:MAG TPA: serine/threonine protein kinase, partial [Minicystis sp.]|nr:serine/threonine protein kinase [Minicystis sp.]